MLGFLLMAAQAATLSSAPVSCEIRAEKNEESTALIGVCGTSAIMLGAVSSYETYRNLETGTAVAVVQRFDDTQVLLVRPDAGGQSFLEDITPDLARRGGRAPGAGLSGLAIDMTDFTPSGLIAVGSMAAKGASSAEDQKFSVQQLMADVALERNLPKEPPHVTEVSASEQKAGVQ